MKFVILAVLLAVVLADEAYPKPDYPRTYEKTTYVTYAPSPYSFSYDVKDDASYNDYSHSQSSDGNVVTGSYRVLLPDGRTQIVTYRADENGYVADVKYEGAAKTYDYKTPEYKASVPAPIAYETATSAPVTDAPATYVPVTYPPAPEYIVPYPTY